MNNLMSKRTFFTASTLLLRRMRTNLNPGVNRQLLALEDAAKVMESDPEGFGDLESDLMDVHKSHREYETQLQQERDQVRHLMVKHKYFREPALPNLLTYAEKEQMRLLHETNPEEWCIDRLAQSFPATPDIIKKILKSNWKPISGKRLRSHDRHVFENWDKLKSGQFDNIISSEFKDHLNKFSNRSLKDMKSLPNAADTYIPFEPTLPKNQQFLSIITSCKKYQQIESQKQQQTPLDDNEIERNSNEKITMNNISLLNSSDRNRYMRLKDFEESIKNRTELEQSFVSRKHSDILDESNNTSSVQRYPDFKEKFVTSEIIVSPEDCRKYEMNSIKERVYIPRKLWRKGATYRIKDCYYDDDGEFLYRVPGMTGLQK